MANRFRCSVCDHPQRYEIEGHLRDGTMTFRAMAARYKLSTASLGRHKKKHLDLPPDWRQLLPPTEQRDLPAVIHPALPADLVSGALSMPEGLDEQLQWAKERTGKLAIYLEGENDPRGAIVAYKEFTTLVSRILSDADAREERQREAAAEGKHEQLLATWIGQHDADRVCPHCGKRLDEEVVDEG